MNASPLLISVVVPTYNRGPAIRHTIQSALLQDLPPEQIEIVIIDDGSTDDTWSFLQDNYRHQPQIRLFSIGNGGVARARNFGLEQARGEFIAYLDHDDIWLPQKLRLQRESLQVQPDVGVVSCLWREVDEAGRDVKKSNLLKSVQSGNLPQGDVFPQILNENFIISMTLPLIRTSLVKQIGGFDPNTVPSDDWDLWIRLAKITRFAVVSEVLAHYVVHPNQQLRDLEKAFKSGLAIHIKHTPNLFSEPILWIKQKNSKRHFKEAVAYHMAKKALVNRRFLRLLPLFGCALLSCPDKAIYKRWLHLFLRAIQGNNQPY